MVAISVKLTTRHTKTKARRTIPKTGVILLRGGREEQTRKRGKEGRKGKQRQKR